MTTLDYKIKRSKRRSISIIISKDGDIIVRAPYVLTDAFIDGFVLSKKDWIDEHLKTTRKYIEAKRCHTADSVRYLGRIFPVTEEDTEKAWFDGKVVHAPKGEKKKPALVKWYKNEAALIIKERVAIFEDRTGLSCEAVKISSASTRWGSCSAKGNLNFSWKLVMAGGREIDYVVVHELCHLVHMDHSKEFWRLVAKYFPCYEEAQDALKALAEELKSEDWDAKKAPQGKIEVDKKKSK